MYSEGVIHFSLASNPMHSSLLIKGTMIPGMCQYKCLMGSETVTIAQLNEGVVRMFNLFFFGSRTQNLLITVSTLGKYSHLSDLSGIKYNYSLFD